MAAGLAIVGRVKDDALLAGYLGVIREIYGDTGSGGQPRLEHGQFHDVLVTGDVVYRFPRDEDSRRQLARRTEVLAALARVQLPVAVPSPVSAVDPGLPLGRSHAVLQRLPGEPLSLTRFAARTRRPSRLSWPGCWTPCSEPARIRRSLRWLVRPTLAAGASSQPMLPRCCSR
jgi:hypothetical protein